MDSRRFETFRAFAPIASFGDGAVRHSAVRVLRGFASAADRDRRPHGRGAVRGRLRELPGRLDLSGDDPSRTRDLRAERLGLVGTGCILTSGWVAAAARNVARGIRGACRHERRRCAGSDRSGEPRRLRRPGHGDDDRRFAAGSPLRAAHGLRGRIPILSRSRGLHRPRQHALLAHALGGRERADRRADQRADRPGRKPVDSDHGCGVAGRPHRDDVRELRVRRAPCAFRAQSLAQRPARRPPHPELLHGRCGRRSDGRARRSGRRSPSTSSTTAARRFARRPATREPTAAE